MTVESPQNPVQEFLDIYDPQGLSDEVLGGLTKELDKKLLTNNHLIKEFLEHDQQQLLLKNYPEYNLVFLNKFKHPHAFAAASRKLEYRVLMDRLGITRSTQVPAGYDDLVCDIGGEFSFHLLNDHQGVHSCNPILDFRDAARSVTRREMLFRHTLSSDYKNYLRIDRYNRIVRFFNDSIFAETISCSKTAQECSRTARYGIGVHSCYDIRLDDYAEMMIRKNMYEIHGTFIFSDIMLLEREGIIPGIDAFYSIDEKREFIEFSFRGDSSTCYKHRLSDYLALVTLNYFVHKPTGTTFMIELGENRAGIQFFKIIRVDGSFPNSELTRYIWLKSLEGMTKINFFDLDERQLARGNYKYAFPKVAFYVETDLVDKIVAHAYASTESKFRPIEIFNYLTAYNGRIFFGSDVCVRNKPLPVCQAMILANAIYVYVFAKKYNLGKIDQLLLNTIKHNRELAEGSIGQKWRSWKYTPPALFSGGHSNTRIQRTILKPLHAFLYWFKKSRTDSVRFLEETVSFVPCSNVIRSCDYVIVDENTGRVFSHQVSAVSVLDDSKVLNIQNLMVDLLEKHVVTGKVLSSDDLLPSKKYVEPLINICVENKRTVANYGLYSSRYKFLLGNEIGHDDSVQTKSRISSVFSKVPSVPLLLEGNTLFLCNNTKFDTKSRRYFLTFDGGDLQGATVVNTSREKFLCDLLRMLTYLPIVNVVVGDCKVLMSELVAIVNVLRCGQYIFVPCFFSHDINSNFLFSHYHKLISGCFVFRKEEDDLERFFCVLESLWERKTCSSVSSLSYHSLVSTPATSFCSLSDSDTIVAASDLDIGINAVLSDVRDVLVPESIPQEPELPSMDSTLVELRDVTPSPEPIVDILPSIIDDIDVCGSLCGDAVVYGTTTSCSLAASFITSEELVSLPPRITKGKLGVRREWLFASRSYTYGRSVVSPIAPFSVVSGFVASLVKHFGLIPPNACLLVNYPLGSRGLSLHSDREETHANEQVITLCFGDPATIVIAGHDRNTIGEFATNDGSFYLFRHQEGFLHGVKNICGTTGRWAFTFRCFRDEIPSPLPISDVPLDPPTDIDLPVPPFSGAVMELGGAGHCLFYCLSGGDLHCAIRLREYIRVNHPATIAKAGDFYCSSEILVECTGDHEAGTATIYAFCYLFRSNVVVYDSAFNILFTCQFYDDPLFVIKLVYCNAHYRRINSCVVDNLCRFDFVIDSIDISQYYDLFVKTFQPEQSFFQKILFRQKCLPKDFYFNTLSHVCLNRSCKCMHGLCSFIERNRNSDALVLLHRNLDNLEEILGFLVAKRITVRFLLIPGMSDKGFFFVLLSFQCPFSPVNISTCLAQALNHMSFCVKCKSKTIMSPPFFNSMYRTYFFCECNDPVRSVSELSSADKVFRVVPKNKINSYSNTLIDRDTFVEVPMKFKSANILSTDRNELNKVQCALDAYFLKTGGFCSVGVETSDVENLGIFVNLIQPKVSCVLVRESKTIFSPSGVNFSPRYVSFIDDNSYIINSMIEVREYYRSSLQTIQSQLRPLHDQYIELISSPKFSGGTASFNNKPDYALVDMTNGTYVVPPKDQGGPYMYAFDGTKLVNISSACTIDRFDKKNIGGMGRSTKWLRPGVFQGYFSVSKETRVISCGTLYEFLSSFDLANFVRHFSIELIEGVPGCGKTHYIVNNHNLSITKPDTVVLTSSREAALDLRRRVSKILNVTPDHHFVKKHYKTVDSFLMHYSTCNYNISTIWLDEGLMRHFGDIMWCAYISGCKNIKIIGDRAQIPFICRLPGVSLRYHLPTLTKRVMDVNFLSTTHRCPVDVAALLNRFSAYDNKVFSSSNVRRSINTRYISSLFELGEGYRDFQFLTFTQSDKETVRKQFGGRVNTVNEFQGNQADNVVLVRLVNKDIPIFKSQSHQLVGMSRHRKQFVYASVCRDPFFEFLSTSISEGDLNSCVVSESVEIIGGGGESVVASVKSVIKATSGLVGGGLVLGKTICKQYPIFNVIPRCAVLIDMVKQDRVLRNFVVDNGGSGTAPYRVNFSPVETPPITIPFSPHYYVSDCITTMQYMYDLLSPGQSLPNFNYDNSIFEQDELYFAVKENFTISSFEKFGTSRFDSLSPSLRTSCPSAVSNNVKHVLKAFYDRNGNVPELQGQADDKKMADLLFSNFVNTYVTDKNLFKRFSDEIIDINVDSIEDWLFTQTPDVRKKAFPEDINCIFMKELNKYSMILKKLPKPKLEAGAEYKFPSPQTIAHSTKDINAVFCPIIKEVKKRLYSILPDNVLIFSDMSADDFEDILSIRLPASKLKRFKYMVEQDFAKFDKSQNRTAFFFELLFLVAFGFPPKLIPIWIFMHVYSRLLHLLSGFKASVFFQRKSGDPMTYLGNTVFLMAVFCSAGLEVISEKIRDGTLFAMFSGDDLLAFLDELLDTSLMTQEYAIRFNLETKILTFGTAYFCSKFLFLTPWGRWILVPDVVKMLTKLGRRDLINQKHVEEYRISCLDVGKHLGNSVLYSLIDMCLKDRYKLSNNGSFGALYSAMYEIFSDVEKFSKLYYIRDGALIDHERGFSGLNQF